LSKNRRAKAFDHFKHLRGRRTFTLKAQSRRQQRKNQKVIARRITEKNQFGVATVVSVSFIPGVQRKLPVLKGKIMMKMNGGFRVSVEPSKSQIANVVAVAFSAGLNRPASAAA